MFLSTKNRRNDRFPVLSQYKCAKISPKPSKTIKNSLSLAFIHYVDIHNSHTHTHTHTHTWHTHMTLEHICDICMYTYIHVLYTLYMNIYQHMYIYIHIYVQTYEYKYIYLCIYSDICIYTYIFIHIYSHQRIWKWKRIRVNWIFI